MNSYRMKLIIPLSLVILIVLTSLGAILGPVMKDFYVERMSERIEKEAYLIQRIVESGNPPFTDLQTIFEEYGEELDLRITLIDEEGAVLVDTGEDPALLENHLMRSEIQQVIDVGFGREIRYSTTIGEELLYFAVPLSLTDGETSFLRLGLEMSELNSLYRNVWIVLITAFLIASFVILYIISSLTNQFTKPIEEAREVALELANGNYRSRASGTSHLEVGELNQSLNILAGNLDQLTTTYEVQQERLETLIENMGSGLILINDKGYITLINKSSRKIFDEDTDLWINELYHEAINHKKVNKFVQEIFLTETAMRKQIKLSIGIYIRHFEVHGAPIIAHDEKLKGIVVVFHEITELKKLEQARKDFVANVSHELKTPVTSLKGFTETLLAGTMDDENLRVKFLTIIANESERLESLIHDLLELSKIEGSHFQLQWQDMDVTKSIDEVFVILEDRIAEKNMKVTKSIIGNTWMVGDPARIKQVLINLINNAIVYTPENGSIHINVSEEKDCLLLEVKDSGIGISKKEIPRIFERFYRVDRARSRNSGGTGLGLAIVKHLAEAHHAKLSVYSKVGEGTVFQIRFIKKQDIY